MPLLGKNDLGQTGTASTAVALSSIDRTAIEASNSETVEQIDLGQKHGCYLFRKVINGQISRRLSMACWGDNALGQFGDGGLVTNSNKVLAISPPIGEPIKVSAGGDTTCELIKTPANDVKLYCHGDNRQGQVGVGSANQNFNIPSLVTFPAVLNSGCSIKISSGDHHSCAINSAGAVKCWGDGGQGQLGQGSLASSNSAIQVTGLTSGVTDISAGEK